MKPSNDPPVDPSCPDANRLDDFVSARLAMAEEVVVTRHLQECPRCRAILESQDGYGTLLGPLRHKVPDSIFDVPATDTAPSPLPSLPKVLGAYQLIKELGRGGMGIVYEACQVRLNQVCAVKVLKPELVSNPRAVERFEREMRTLGPMKHRNLVLAHYAGWEDGHYLLAMEYLEGTDLQALVTEHQLLPIGDACEVVRQAAVGLQYIHEKHQAVHRDIKPSNLMVTPEGCVKILDLGLARLTSEDQPTDATTGQVFLGTVDYMAPEQAENAHAADIRADMYSLGCTLYHFLAGQPPFAGSDYDSKAKKIAGHARDAAPPIRHVRPETAEGLAVILERMMAKRPEDRFQTPAEVAAALQPFTAGHNLPALLKQSPILPSVEQTTPWVDDSTGRRPPNGAAQQSERSPVRRPRLPRSLIRAIRQHPIRATLWGLALPIVVAVVLGIGLNMVPPSPTESVWGTQLTNPRPRLFQLVPARIEANQDEPLVALRNRQARALVVSPDGKLVFVAEVEQKNFTTQVRIFSVEENKPVTEWNFKGDNYWNLAISPDGKKLAAPSNLEAGKQHAKIWDRDTNWKETKLGEGIHTKVVISLAFSPDSRMLVVGSGHKMATVWDVDTGKQVPAPSLEKYKELKGMDFYSLAFSPHTKPSEGLLAVGTACGQVLIFKTDGFEEVTSFQAHGASGGIHGLAFSPDGETLATSDSVEDSTVKLWSVRDVLQNKGEPQPYKVLPVGRISKRLAFSPNGQFLAVGGTGDHLVSLWNLEKGTRISLSASIETSGNLQFFPDGKRLAVIGPKGTHLWRFPNLPGNEGDQ